MTYQPSTEQAEAFAAQAREATMMRIYEHLTQIDARPATEQSDWVVAQLRAELIRRREAANGDRASERQVDYIMDLAPRHRWSQAYAREDVAALTKVEASILIDAMGGRW